MKNAKIKHLETKIQHILSEAIFNELTNQVFKKCSVTGVKLSNDNSVAKVYVNFFGVKNTEEVLYALRGKGGFLRKELAKNIDTRRTPFLEFELDDSFEKIHKIEKLIDESKGE